MSPSARQLRELAESLLLPFLQGGDDPCALFARALERAARRAEGLGVKGLRHLASLLVPWIDRRPAPVDGAARDLLESWVQGLTGFLIEPADPDEGVRLLESLPSWPGMPEIPPQFMSLIADRLRQDAGVIRQAVAGEMPAPVETTPTPGRGAGGLETAPTVRVARDELDMLREAVDMLCAELATATAEAPTDALRRHVHEELLKLSQAAGFIGLEVLALLAGRIAEEALGSETLRLRLPALRAILECLSRWLADPARHAAELLQAWTVAMREQAQAPHAPVGAQDAARVLPSPAARQQIGAALAAVEVGASRRVVVTGEPTDEAALSLRIPADADPTVVDQWLQELPELAGAFAQEIAALAAAGDLQREETLFRAQRLAHSIKGSAHTVGIRGVATITHQLEDLLHLLGRQEGALPEGVLPALLAAADCLGEMSDFLAGRGSEPRATRSLSDALTGWIHLQLEEEAPRASAPLEASAALRGPPTPEPEPVAADGVSTAPGVAPEAGEWVRVPARLLDRLLDLAGEAAIQLSQAEEHAGSLARSRDAVRLGADRLQGLASEAERLSIAEGPSASRPSRAPARAFDALEMDAFGELQMLSARLTEAGTDARLIDFQLDRQLGGLRENLGELERIHAELRETILQARTLTVSAIVPRLQRAVRQAARMSGREVELEVVGEHTALDGHLLQQLVDPLMHLLRNAVDHGIESAPERAVSGKPETGHIRLAVSRTGSWVRVECHDDGRGLDFPAIRRRAHAQGLLPTEAAGSEQDLARLVLLPGFSTRDQATPLSGRGMGLDVAAAAVRQWRGRIGIESTPGQGARIVLEIPELFSTVPVIVATLGAVRIGVAVSGVEGVVSAEGACRDASGETMLALGAEVLRVRRLEELLSLPASLLEDAAQKPEELALLVRQPDGERVAVAAAGLSQARPMVVRPLPSWLSLQSWHDGATVLGDGSVVAVVDLPRLLAGAVPGLARRRVRLPPSLPRCLIADDSVSVRRSMELFLRDLGLEVEACVDGLQALERARVDPPAVAIIDLEMPRMDGLALAAALRAEPATSRIPILMITSRFSPTHRDRAMAAGVDVFLSKPYDEDELATHVRACLERGRRLG